MNNFNFEENVLKVYHCSIQPLFHRFSCNFQDTLSLSLANYPAMEIDEIDAEHCDGKLQKNFFQN